MIRARSRIPAGELGLVRVRNEDRNAWMNLRLVRRQDPADLVIVLQGEVAGRGFRSAHKLTWEAYVAFGRILADGARRDCTVRVDLRFFGEAIVELDHHIELRSPRVDEAHGEIRFATALGTTYLIRKRYSPDGGPEVEAAPGLPLWTWAGLALGAGIVTCGLVYTAGSVVQSGMRAQVGFDMESGLVGVDPRLVDALAGALRTEGGLQLPAPGWG